MSDVKIKELDKSLIHQANNNSMSGKRGDISARLWAAFSPLWVFPPSASTPGTSFR